MLTTASETVFARRRLASAWVVIKPGACRADTAAAPIMAGGMDCAKPCAVCRPNPIMTNKPQ